MILSSYSLQFRHKTSVVPLSIILMLLAFEESKFRNYRLILVLSLPVIYLLIL